MTEKSYSVDDAQSDAGHVAVLLDIALELHLEMPVEEAAGLHQAQRISTLLWVARDLAQMIDRSIEENYSSLRSRFKTGEV